MLFVGVVISYRSVARGACSQNASRLAHCSKRTAPECISSAPKTLRRVSNCDLVMHLINRTLIGRTQKSGTARTHIMAQPFKPNELLLCACPQQNTGRKTSCSEGEPFRRCDAMCGRILVAVAPLNAAPMINCTKADWTAIASADLSVGTCVSERNQSAI